MPLAFLAGLFLMSVSTQWFMKFLLVHFPNQLEPIDLTAESAGEDVFQPLVRGKQVPSSSLPLSSSFSLSLFHVLLSLPPVNCALLLQGRMYSVCETSETSGNWHYHLRATSIWCRTMCVFINHILSSIERSCYQISWAGGLAPSGLVRPMPIISMG